jgi:hypothetical protein
MPHELVQIITSPDAAVRNRSLEGFCRAADALALLGAAEELDRFRRTWENLYERVRAIFFLSAIYRYYLPQKLPAANRGLVPFDGYTRLLARRFEEAVDAFLAVQARCGPSDAVASALAAAYRELGFQTLAERVRQSVRAVRGNQWMFRVGHPADHPLELRRELLRRDAPGEPFPVLCERTPVRMDLSHAGWSDIFFLGMDYPEGARVLNVSVDLGVRSRDEKPREPIEVYLRVIDEPVLRLASVDLRSKADVTSLAEVFDFAKDYLGLLKAGLIAAGIVPPGLEGSGRQLADVLARLVGPGLGLELVSKVNDIPKGSRLAVSTNLLAAIITACMRATGQIQSLVGPPGEAERMLVAARAILGEWLGGSGGGWQDSGGIWPGMKIIEGRPAEPGDPEFGVSRGRLLPDHHIYTEEEVGPRTRELLCQSFILVHGGMAQNVGPILEMVTEKYLLRGEAEWAARQEAGGILRSIEAALAAGDVRRIARDTSRNFAGPIQTIIPWASNDYTETLIGEMRRRFAADYWGFLMLGGISGGGMGFIVAPRRKVQAQDYLQELMSATKRRLHSALPFAMEPVVYDFAVNDTGTTATLSEGAEALMPPAYYALCAPAWLRQDARSLSRVVQGEIARFAAACRTHPRLAGSTELVLGALFPQPAEEHLAQTSLRKLLDENGFDPELHEQIRTDLRSGRIGLAQNRLPASSEIEDAAPGDVIDWTTLHSPLPSGEGQGVRGPGVEGAVAASPVHPHPNPLPEGEGTECHRAGKELLRDGRVAVLALAGGAGSRWTQGAGVVKALHPFCRFHGKYRNFIEVHLAKARRAAERFQAGVPYVLSTSYLTHEPIAATLAAERNYGYAAPLLLSPGRSVGLRMVPMPRDLRFAWEELPQQLLDVQAQKVRESLHASLLAWAEAAGGGSDYSDNLPLQCLHPTGHWFEVPNFLRNGTLARLLDERPQLAHLMLHNIDTLGADLDPGLLGLHARSGACLTFEVIPRRIEDRGGGLARVNGSVRLVEGLALAREEDEFRLSYYNSMTTWIAIDRLLQVFGLGRSDLADEAKVTAAIRRLSLRLPTYVTLKDVKKRWGHGQEDVFPVAQFEKLWGDMTGLAEIACRFVVVPRLRGQQLKGQAQLDGWLRDGSAAYVGSLCAWK